MLLLLLLRIQQLPLLLLLQLQLLLLLMKLSLRDLKLTLNFILQQPPLTLLLFPPLSPKSASPVATWHIPMLQACPPSAAQLMVWTVEEDWGG